MFRRLFYIFSFCFDKENAYSFCSLIFVIPLSALRSPSILMMRTSCNLICEFVDHLAVCSWIRESPRKLKVIPSVMSSRVTCSGSFLVEICDSVALLEETISRVSP